MGRLIAWLLLVPIVALAAAPLAAQAQADLPPGADIVFVVDQSGSMSRGTVLNSRDPRCTPTRTPECPRSAPTDPDGLALKAVNDGVGPIFERMVLRSYVRDLDSAAEEEYRFGLVLFGGAETQEESALTAVPLTRIAIERGEDGTLRSNIARQLPTEPRNLGETAFSRAFAQVCTMLNCAAPTPPNRKRVVVLLTDGQPSLDSIHFDGVNPEPYFEALRAEHADLFQNAEMWVLGLDRTDQFWSKNAPFWNQIAPDRTFLLTDPKDIAARFRAVARTIVGDPPGEVSMCDGGFFKVDPYRSSMTLILEYPEPGIKAEFKLPDGTALSRTTGNVLVSTSSAQSETYVIDGPAPGAWRCAIVGSGVTPRFRTITGEFTPASARIALPEGPPASTCRDFNLAVRYFDEDGQPIAELPTHPFDHTLTVRIDGQPITRKLVHDRAGQGYWSAEGMLTPGARGGSYPVRVDLRLPDGTALLSATDEIMIDPRLPCMRLVAPANGGVSQMYESLDLTDLELSVLLTQGEQPGELAGVFREDPARLVTGQLEGPDGFSRPLQLQPLAGQPGIFAARVGDLQAAGAYTFTAALRATTQDGAAYELAPQTVTFTRVPDPFWLQVRWGLRAAIVLAAMVVLALFGYFLFLITGPFPHGTLVLERRATGALAETREWDQVTSIALSGQRLFFGLLRTRRPMVKRRVFKELGLRALKVRRVVSGKDAGIQVTLVRDQKRNPVSFQFFADKEYKTFDSKYRITYENYGVRRKSR
jgi:hypothetical protein